MSYEAWRISFQSSEQAARVAYAELEKLREKENVTALCISPACGNGCSDCNCALTLEQVAQYARRYAYLRDRDLDAIVDGGVFAGQVPENVVLNGDDLDAAIDAAMLTPNADGNATERSEGTNQRCVMLVFGD